MTILACKDYDGPASYLAESSELVAVDPDNLAKSFAAPASGNVLVRLTGYVTTEPNNEMYFGLIDADADSQVGPVRRVAGNPQEYFSAVVSVALVVRNLVPGDQYRYQWAYAATGEAGLHNAAADGYPPAVIEIHALL